MSVADEKSWFFLISLLTMLFEPKNVLVYLSLPERPLSLACLVLLRENLNNEDNYKEKYNTELLLFRTYKTIEIYQYSTN